MERLLLKNKPRCRVCHKKMDYLEDIRREEVNYQVFTCFKHNTFKIRPNL